MKKYLAIYLSATWFFILLNSLILMSSIVVHEFGHLIFGQLEGCYGRIILFDERLTPYTELWCPKNTSILPTLGGLIFVFLFSFLFLPLKLAERELSVMVFGLSILLAASDFVSINPKFFLPSLLIGSAIIIFGETRYIHRKLIDIESSL